MVEEQKGRRAGHTHGEDARTYLYKGGKDIYKTTNTVYVDQSLMKKWATFLTLSLWGVNVNRTNVF